MGISISHITSLSDCETFCERFLIDAFTIWCSNARLKQSFKSMGGADD